MSDDPISGNRIVWDEGCSVMLFTYDHGGTPPPAAALMAALAPVFMARRRD